VMWCGCHKWRRLFRQYSMGIRGMRAVAALLAVSAADVGLWASFAPGSFFRSFPGGGHHWVSAIGPYDEHLVRDVGGLYLSLLAVSVWAVVRPRPEIRRLAGVAWLVFSIPHLAFHAAHLGSFGLADQVGNMVALGGAVVLAIVLLLPGARGPADTDVTRHRAAPSSGRARAGREPGEVG
jgi:hypothetical protein